MNELFNKIHDIFDKAVSKQVGNMAHILAFLCNSASRQRNEIWASHLPFLHTIKDTVLSSEVCLYGFINWNLAQVQQPTCYSLSWSFISVRDGKTKKLACNTSNVHLQQGSVTLTLDLSCQ